MGCGIRIKIMKVIISNKDKKVKWICEFDNNLIVFTYYLELFFTLSYIIELFYQIYLIYFIIEIKLLNHFKLLSWFIKQPPNKLI